MVLDAVTLHRGSLLHRTRGRLVLLAERRRFLPFLLGFPQELSGIPCRLDLIPAEGAACVSGSFQAVFVRVGRRSAMCLLAATPRSALYPFVTPIRILQ